MKARRGEKQQVTRVFVDMPFGIGPQTIPADSQQIPLEPLLPLIP